MVESQAEARVAAETLLNTNLRADNLKLQHAFKECSLAEVFSPALEFQNDWEE